MQLKGMDLGTNFVPVRVGFRKFCASEGRVLRCRPMPHQDPNMQPWGGGILIICTWKRAILFSLKKTFQHLGVNFSPKLDQKVHKNHIPRMLLEPAVATPGMLGDTADISTRN